jgi:hypothetical protein
MRVTTESKRFKKEIDNIMSYSFGFLDGVQKGKTQLFNDLAPQIVELASQYIDSNARVTPELLHHVYEWTLTGSPKARLFDIDYTISPLGISFKSNLRQSTSIKEGSNVPFSDKAKIMEAGLPVTIKPKKANVLSFDIDGEQIFTSNPVVVTNPGGETKGQFEKVINEFFGVYFRQSFLKTSGLSKQFKYPKAYKKDLPAGSKSGRSQGIKTGYRWIANASLIGVK